jgi:hypothetical protein
MQDKEGLEKFQEQAEKIVAPVSEDQQKSLEKFHGSWIMLTEAAEGFETAIGAKLAPVLQPIIDSVREWMTANREWLTTEISKNVKQLSDWLSNIPWKDTVKGITDFAHSALDLADHLGGARIAVGALGLVMGAEMLPKIKQTIGLAETIGEIMVGPFAEAFMEGGKALWAGEGAMEAFNTALLENPIALIVSAVILLGLAAYEIYEHWDGVKDFFSKLWEKVVGLFQSNAFYLRTIVELIGGIPLLLFMAWRAVTPFFTALWDVVKGVFKSAWDYIGPIVDKIGKSVSVITNGISGVAGKVGSSISSVGHGIAHTAGSIADSVAGEMDHAYGYAPAGMASGTRAIPSPYDKPATPAAAQKGHVAVTVSLTNAPPGTSISATSSGIAQAPKTSVGYGYHQAQH